MIEIDHLSSEGRDCIVRLRCACGAPRLALYPCLDGLVIYCHHCGELSTRDRLLNHSALPLASPNLIWLNATNHAACPPVEVSIPVVAEFASSLAGAGRFKFSAFITALSPEEGLLRLEAATQARQDDGFRRVHLKSREATLNFETTGYVEDVLRPHGPEGAIFYKLKLSLASPEQRAQIELLTLTSAPAPFDGRMLLYGEADQAARLETAIHQGLPKARVELARDGAEFIKLVETLKPEILLSSANSDLIRQIREAGAGGNGTGRAMIALVEPFTSEAVSQALHEGADEVLAGDCNALDLARVVQRWEARRAAEPMPAETDKQSALLTAGPPVRSGQVLPVTEEDVIRMLCMASETHDSNSANHLSRMSAYTAAIARHLQWPSWRVARLATASKLHDVGKLGVPDAILRKTGALTGDERKVMQEHTRFGHQILSASTSDLMRLGAIIALRHHERFDGTGYPDGLGGQAIPIEAQIVSISDVFDALTTARAYKPAWSNEKAVAYIREQSGRMFNPLVVEAYLDVLPAIEKIQQQFKDDLHDLWVERRQNKRYPAQPTPINIEIALPEQTFRPFPLHGFMRDISRGGMRLVLNNVSLDLFTLLISTRRYAKIVCLDPAWRNLHQAFCSVVWLDYYAVPDSNGCLMGLCFQKEPAELEPALAALEG